MNTNLHVFRFSIVFNVYLLYLILSHIYIAI